MRKSGLLNPALTSAVARLGHTDTFVIADCGLPIPHDVPVIDLTLTFGIPTFADTLATLLEEVVVEAGTIADTTPPEVRSLLPAIPLTEVSHDDLKREVARASFVVRTGSTTPFANVILRSGVPF
ncbi:D-ribose pyranase [Corynebacterium marquesiae]|uniref:D-ribose pyranase n=1 Tax=Corynebacterium marquesiae TaxID=2913503 RepID=A0ABU8P4I6_9CORY|nr:MULTISPECIES: D-ribose pyranase [Corynebacterium]MDK8455408.1 D-ribose pyranase [Corynebacterium marquesiae]MDK8480728.1 D-ribose pyranase [Corynebacterium marquesiae]MDK8496516.1 D-ribose pyranase [Corynebacterium marquesiae]MDK8531895.1 D-ribose pyranase [Corynebacterium marquesiae]MDK8667957.1 D-ribose pyranase [Corynebacterium marquesiae]